MARAIEPSDYGINMNRDEFRDQAIDELNREFRGQITVDELLLQPEEAIKFRDAFLTRYGHKPTDKSIVFRSMMTRRKNPR
jgi:hypothetical protein